MSVEHNPAKWDEKEREQFLKHGFRELRKGETPICSPLVRPVDYDNDLSRGTVDFNPEWRNYAFHSVVIPDGTKVRRCNFYQITPGTQAIGGADLEFEDCNLVNCTVDPSWKLVNCNNSQHWIVRGAEKEERVVIAERSADLNGDEQAPANAILRRDF